MLKPDYKIEKLTNGLTIVLEEIPALRSVSVGILVGTGSSSETEEIAGISHFVEHMLFKGTAKRSAYDIAKEIDAIGGKINAGTDKEYTSYYAVVLDTHLDVAINILSDMYLNSVFDKDEINKERNVILEEIGMYEDTPDENIHDLACQNILDGHPLGRTVLGSAESIKKINKEKLLDYFKKNYTPDNTIIAVAGNFKADEALALIKENFSRLPGKRVILPEPEINIKPGTKIYKKETEQAHLCLSTRGVSFKDEDRFALSLLSSVLGRNMSSRLFQKIREQKGLVYSIYTYPTFFKNAGIFTCYAGTNVKNAQEVVDITLKEFQLLKEKGITAEELSRVKEQLKGNMVLGMESSSSRMSWLAKSYYYYNEVKNLDEVFKKIDRVSADDVQRLANKFFISESLQLTAIGNFPKKNFFQELIC